MMDTKQIASALDGSEYQRGEIDKDITIACQDNGIVIVCGASDDLMEFYGAFREELSAYGGTTAYLNSDGLIENKCESDECPYFQEIIEKAVEINAIWRDDDSPAWTYETKIPHETFLVWDEGTEYCRGIVFYLSDVEAAKLER